MTGKGKVLTGSFPARRVCCLVAVGLPCGERVRYSARVRGTGGRGGGGHVEAKLE